MGFNKTQNSFSRRFLKIKDLEFHLGDEKMNMIRIVLSILC